MPRRACFPAQSSSAAPAPTSPSSIAGTTTCPTACRASRSPSRRRCTRLNGRSSSSRSRSRRWSCATPRASPTVGRCTSGPSPCVRGSTRSRPAVRAQTASRRSPAGTARSRCPAQPTRARAPSRSPRGRSRAMRPSAPPPPRPARSPRSTTSRHPAHAASAMRPARSPLHRRSPRSRSSAVGGCSCPVAALPEGVYLVGAARPDGTWHVLVANLGARPVIPPRAP